ncbi:MAG: hypothetical protein Q7T22_06760 [Serpentinimonas sp.]|nr:hypothetical protein [Serpentinimonas sp.]
MLNACAQGLPLGAALQAAPSSDPAQTLHTLLGLGVFCRPGNLLPFHPCTQSTPT